MLTVTFFQEVHSPPAWRAGPRAQLSQHQCLDLHSALLAPSLQFRHSPCSGPQRVLHFWGGIVIIPKHICDHCDTLLCF